MSRRRLHSVIRMAQRLGHAVEKLLRRDPCPECGLTDGHREVCQLGRAIREYADFRLSNWDVMQ